MRSLFVLLLSLWTTQALAFFTTMETAEVVPEGTYRLGLEPQIVFTPSGFNLLGYFDAPVAEDRSIRVQLGVGETDFQTSFFYKWVPFPDYGNQPAIGFRSGALYARDGDNTYLGIQLQPIVSKKYDTDFGVFTPYASLPVGLITTKNKTTYPVQLAIGTEYDSNQLEKLFFAGEIGFDVKDASSYISASVILWIDDREGIQLK